jgi:glycogen(starch) synthase
MYPLGSGFIRNGLGKLLMASIRKRVCVVTSYPADREPRGPRHARALWDLGICSEMTFIDSSPQDGRKGPVDYLDGIANLRWLTNHYATRSASPTVWLYHKLIHQLNRAAFSTFGWLSNSSLTPNLSHLERLIASSQPELIMAHNIDTLLPAFRVARRNNAMLVFDSMEFHSDMGDGQDTLQCKLISAIERTCLPFCELVTTSSQRVAQALQDTYGIRSTVPLYNSPKTVQTLNVSKHPGFTLYWRNSTIGLGQRGLAEAIRALAILPLEITLHLQGRQPPGGARDVIALIRELGVHDRVTLHPPFLAEHAVIEAARFHVGLCLERSGIRNHELTVSNKMFDYHMAGLAVVTSDMPALTDIVERSRAGVVFKAGDHRALAVAIMSLYSDTARYLTLTENARKFALSDGNLEHEMQRFGNAILSSPSLCN